MEPPAFEEAARCGVCKCNFNTFRRRHHCRSCGRTFCNEHSSNQMALPQLGVHTSVRVCIDCFNNPSRRKDKAQDFEDSVASVSNTVSKLDISSDSTMKTKPNDEKEPVLGVPECTCGMPLCICEAPNLSVNPVPLQMKSASSSGQVNPKPKIVNATPKNRASASKSTLGSVFNPGQSANGTLNESRTDYEVNGEGLREAIKNSDMDAVRKLLSEGVDANYCDKQGMSLLHLAAVFNQTDIVFTLMESGASVDRVNAQGETPLDCAPAMLQYKMRQKIEATKQV